MKFLSNNFTTELPDDWDDRTMVTFIAPLLPNSFASNVVITRHFVELSTTMEDFAEEQTQMMQSSLINYQVIDRRRTDVNGAPALQQLHRFQTESGMLQQAQTFVLNNKIIYVLTCTATERDFEAHVPAFRDIVENFRLSN